MTERKPTDSPDPHGAGQAGDPSAPESDPREADPRAGDPRVGDPDALEPEAPGVDAAAEPGSDREAELEAELADAKDRLLRALAEIENLRRRTMRDLEEAHKYAVTNFARELLEVADNLSRALDAVPPRARDEIDFVKTLADGVAMTEKALLACFERHKIEKVTPEIGDRFDHNRHQAMFEVATAEQAPGTVAQVLQPGYTLAERLLRPALVGVAKAPANGPGDGGGEAADEVAHEAGAEVGGGRDRRVS